MKQKNRNTKPRDWRLVLIASIYMVIGLALVVISVVNIPLFGWWSLLFGLTGATPVAASIVSLIRNDPSWIMLDLILPG